MSDSSLSFQYQAFGASIAGARHIRDQIPCEDAWARENIPDGIVIAVADGLSSADEGGKGAMLAVTSSVRAAAEAFQKENSLQDELDSIPDFTEIIRSSFRKGREAIDSFAHSEGMDLSSYATTLLLALISSGEVYCGHIGDGACVIMNGEDLTILSAPGNAEYANETAVLTGSDWEKQLRISSAPADAMVLATDGCQGALIQKQDGESKPYSPFIVPLVKSLKRFSRDRRDCDAEIADLLSSSRMRALSSDDMTLAVGLCLSGESD